MRSSILRQFFVVPFIAKGTYGKEKKNLVPTSSSPGEEWDNKN